MLLVSSPTPHHQGLVARVSDDFAVTVTFIDDDTPRDVTAMAADLAVVGIAETAAGLGADISGQPGTIVGAHLDVTGADDAVVFVFDQRTAAGFELGAVDLIEAIAVGVRAQVAAGVAAEAAEDEDDGHEPSA